ncbi:MAG: tRNA/rRNA methyltransferase [Candidatus Amesbacteria bacterium GW2011_GWA1_48_9]|uniref:tRNA/rRNA methyltransferase n=4 Tax=Candidatus Amesiibacteriota TaxID=1752730 RepID=A0A0G1UL38_9BACT|nr:MAG: tRNA/rRNA methyltransferase [Candidatus Amesbacteria bacterium GW2011_GWC1_48_10]KKW00116.1 MAG: tRNA/rRNA methyltransferase [Candidatus Amesbacteria bacterium GW2011_GWA1_48_9]
MINCLRHRGSGRASSIIWGMKLGAKELRLTKPSEADLAKIKRRPIWIILDNVMDTYNIGSIFRLADAVAAQEVLLCGGSETPPASRIHKAAVGTEEWVQWQYMETAVLAIAKLKNQNSKIKIIAVEQDERAIPYNSPLHPSLNLREGTPIAIVVGHETEGVSKEVLDMADVIVEIPMYGVNRSMNVVVATGIVLYRILG